MPGFPPVSVAVTDHAVERFRQRVGGGSGELDVRPVLAPRVGRAWGGGAARPQPPPGADPLALQSEPPAAVAPPPIESESPLSDPVPEPQTPPAATPPPIESGSP